MIDNDDVLNADAGDDEQTPISTRKSPNRRKPDDIHNYNTYNKHVAPFRIKWQQTQDTPAINSKATRSDMSDLVLALKSIDRGRGEALS